MHSWLKYLTCASDHAFDEEVASEKPVWRAPSLPVQAHTKQPPYNSTPHLTALRDLMQEHKMDYYLISTNDAHGSEFVGQQDKRLAFISGFTGDTGTAVVTRDDAYVFVDGRFWTAAASEVDDNWTIMKVGKPGVPGWVAWLAEQGHEQERIGLSAALFNYDAVTSLRDQVASKNMSLVFPPNQDDLVDQIWKKQPRRTANLIFQHPLELAGQSAASKLANLRAELSQKKSSAYLASELAEVAWLLNLRGSDVENCPLFYSYLLVTAFGSTLFVEKSQITSEVLSYLQDLKVDVHPYETITAALKASDWSEPCMLSGNSPYFLVDAIGESQVIVVPSPIAKARSIKNSAEIAAMKKASLQDAVAWTRWSAELEERLQAGEAITEFQAAALLIQYCSKQKDFVTQSYEPAFQNGPNGAKPHYFPPEHGSPVIDTKALTVVDIGCQYRTGTTDTTRTFHWSPKHASAEHKRVFTRVLQGHAALDSAVFPEGTTGSQLDVLARAPMWQDGRNYTHGTGHGIGAFLNVHEWPGIAPGYTREPVVAGQIFSNEPGYYVEGQYGVRLESAILTKPCKTDVEFGGKWLKFERLTQIPIQKSLVDFKLLSASEKKWLEEHNEACRKAVLPLLGDDKRAIRWLKRQ